MRSLEKKVFFFLSLVCTALIFAAIGEEVTDAVSDLCASMQNLLPVAAMLMIVLGAVIYAAGQLMGAETRARANVWATASLTGALFGILITSVSQPILSIIYPGISCSGGDGSVPCANAPDGECAAGFNCCPSGFPFGYCITEQQLCMDQQPCANSGESCAILLCCEPYLCESLSQICGASGGGGT